MRNLRTEKEIMANWKGDLSMPVVSVCCIAYNHEPYIEDALEGFLIQETDFPFEIIVHDDASSDDTKNIINNYYIEYPNIIRCIFQVENQYKTRGFAFIKDVFIKARADYLAICEGDDYWIDPDKLNVQYNALENTGMDICFTKAEQIDRFNSINDICSYSSKEKIFSLSDVIIGRGGFMPTASLLIRKTQHLLDMPDGFYSDHYIQMISSKRFGALFIPKKTCTYRFQTSGSWSSTAFINDIQEKNLEIAIEKLYEFKKILNKPREEKALKKLLYLYLRQYSFIPNIGILKKFDIINCNSGFLFLFDKLKLLFIATIPYSNYIKGVLLRCIRK